MYDRIDRHGSKGGETMTPNQLAAKLAGSDNAERVGKAFVRPFLRRHFTRDASQKGTSWQLTYVQIATVTAAYKARQKGQAFDVDAYRKSLRSRKSRKSAPVTVDAA